MLWILVNLLIPVLLPYLMLSLVILDSLSNPLTPPAPGRAPLWLILLKKSVSTGQLFWTSISLLASTSYDVASSWERQSTQHEIAASALLTCIFLSFIGTSGAALCTFRAAIGQEPSWWTIGISIAITVAVSILYPVFHFAFQ